MVDLTLEIIDYLLSKFQQSIIIVGHSMGGSVAVHAANLRQE
jgi:pimeloyl-ACP methyl ester carboxylesterase